MKFLIKLTLLACVLLSVLTRRRKWNNFGGAAASCSNWRVAGNMLTANCKNAQGQGRDTTIDIDTCITNNNGAFNDGGAASRSCTNLHVEGTLLKGICKNMQGQDRQAAVDLSTVFANINGVLRCR